jgi:hypothetical protein
MLLFDTWDPPAFNTSDRTLMIARPKNPWPFDPMYCSRNPHNKYSTRFAPFFASEVDRSASGQGGSFRSTRQAEQSIDLPARHGSRSGAIKGPSSSDSASGVPDLCLSRLLWGPFCSITGAHVAPSSGKSPVSLPFSLAVLAR